MPKLFFARYTVFSGNTSLKKFDVLLNGLRDEASTNQLGFVYRFFDTEVFTFNEEEFIAGHLVKYDPDDQEEVVNEETLSLDLETVPNKVVGKARFILYPAWSILMFCGVPRAISPQTFMKIFSKLFEENHDNFFTSFTVSLITERYSFIEKVKRYKVIRKIMITLFPSNPNFSDRWKRIDERLRENHIDKYKETQENYLPGGTIKVDNETEGKFLMSEDGYGTSRVSGIDENGNEKTVSTKDVEKGVFENVSPEFDQPKSYVEIVYSTILDIIQRTTK